MPQNVFRAPILDRQDRISFPQLSHEPKSASQHMQSKSVSFHPVPALELPVHDCTFVLFTNLKLLILGLGRAWKRPGTYDVLVSWLASA